MNNFSIVGIPLIHYWVSSPAEIQTWVEFFPTLFYVSDCLYFEENILVYGLNFLFTESSVLFPQRGLRELISETHEFTFYYFNIGLLIFSL